MMSRSSSIARRKYLPLSEPDFDSLRASIAAEEIDRDQDPVQALEEAFAPIIGSPSASAVISATAGLHLALKLAGVSDRDEVVCPTLTFAATCNPILYERGVPIFIDSEPRTWNMDPELLAAFLKRRAALNRLPKAVIVVHLFGQSAELSPILEACNRYELPLIEDAAESLGGLYRGQPTGSFGAAGVFSFNTNKIITGTAGGMLVSRRPGWTDKARFWSSQAREKDPEGLRNYLHAEVGFNYRLSPLLASAIRRQLELLPSRVQQKRAIAFRYRDALEELGLSLMPQASDALHTYWLSCFLLDAESFGVSRAELIRHLSSSDIESRPVWKPLHTQKAFAHFETVRGGVAEDLHRRGICLPSSNSLSEEDQDLVVRRIQEVYYSARHSRFEAPLSERMPGNSG